jgi:glycosyltransferase involved in cell wall biosynthesis
MKIGLNLLHVRPEIGGGWNYITSVVSTLKLLPLDFEFVAYCTRVSAEIVPVDSRFKVRLVDLGSSSQVARIIYEQFILPFRAHHDKVDCIHWFANNRSTLGIVPSVVTIHDFKFVDRPKEVSSAKGFYLREMARFACQRADVLAPISEVTADAATRLFGVERERSVVVPNPLDDTFRPVSSEQLDEFRGRLRLPSQYWLYVAHPYPHKNHPRLFSAYKKLRESSQCTWPLVLRGDRTKGNEILDRIAAECGIAESLVWIPRLTSGDMASLYSAATAMIFPSLYEGCGIPVLEAMACGCPVIASDINTTKEFAGDAALMFDAANVDAITCAMEQFYVDTALRESCAAKGLLKAEQYSSINVAERLRALYEKLSTK